ncbi:hypothetical protein V8G54_035724 [Vigna mungo]|uniref:Uncharacterized protein n=1 Tax=Vigna mungo TaxID=3915 RepID=A0AAQ3MFL8_VIGMU
MKDLSPLPLKNVYTPSLTSLTFGIKASSRSSHRATSVSFFASPNRVFLLRRECPQRCHHPSVHRLATLFPVSEIINSDKMQVYCELDITTNKIPLAQRRGVPNHFLSDVDPSLPEFSPANFCRRAAHIIDDISSRDCLPIVVGGSNSFVHALLVEDFQLDSNVFHDAERLISSELRYKCCFLGRHSFPCAIAILVPPSRRHAPIGGCVWWCVDDLGLGFMDCDLEFVEFVASGDDAQSSSPDSVSSSYLERSDAAESGQPASVNNSEEYSGPQSPYFGGSKGAEVVIENVADEEEKKKKDDH